MMIRVCPAELEPSKGVCLVEDRISKILDCNAVGSIWTLTLAVYFNSLPARHPSNCKRGD